MKAWCKRVFADTARVTALVTFLAVAVGLLMFHVWNEYRIVQIGYEIAEVTTQHRQLLEENKKLAIEAAVVGRTERLSTVARTRYGLEPVRPEQVRPLAVDVAGGGVIGAGEHAALAR